MSGVHIRPMRPEDYDAVYALWMASPNMGFNNLDDSREGVERLLRRNPDTCFVALGDDGLAGVILAGQDGRRGYIYHMAVAEAHRGQGVGTALVKTLKAELKARGVSKIGLTVSRKNADAIRFYEKNGFHTLLRAFGENLMRADTEE